MLDASLTDKEQRFEEQRWKDMALCLPGMNDNKGCAS